MERSIASLFRTNCCSASSGTGQYQVEWADLSWGAVSNVAYYAIYKDNGKERKAEFGRYYPRNVNLNYRKREFNFVTSLFKNNAESEISETVSY